MTNALALPKLAGEFAQTPALFDQFTLPDAKLKMDINFLRIKAQENPQIPAEYWVDFIQKSQLTGADPRVNEIYLIPRKKKINEKNEQGYWSEKWITVATVVFSYMFFIAKAKEQSDYDGFDMNTEPEPYFNPGDSQMYKVLTSTCSVSIKGRSRPFVYKARWPEFVVMKNGKPNHIWGSKSYLMLDKCAIACAHRQAYPEALHGMYISEEMHAVTDEEADKTPANISTYATEINFKKKVDNEVPQNNQQQQPENNVIDINATTQDAGPPPEPDFMEDQGPSVENQPVDPPQQQKSNYDPQKSVKNYAPQKTQQKTTQTQQQNTQQAPQGAMSTNTQTANGNGVMDTKGPLASMRIKGALFSLMQAEGKKGTLKFNDAVEKLKSVRLTETLANDILNKLQSGDALWFDSTTK